MGTTTIFNGKAPESELDRLLAQGFTQSEMQTLDNCPTRWRLRYFECLEKKGAHSWALDYGTAIHMFLENWYGSKGKKNVVELQSLQSRNILANQEKLAEYTYWKRLLEIQTATYASHYKHDFKLFKVHRCEHVASVRYRGFDLRGKLDLGMVDRRTGDLFLWDHKTASRIDSQQSEAWQMRFQFMFYIWLARKDPEWNDIPVKGFMVNIIKKPGLKKGDREPDEAFLQRVQSDMLATPEKYFVRESLPLQKDALDRFQSEVLDPKIDALELIFGRQEDRPKIDVTTLGNDMIHNALMIRSAIMMRRNTDNCFHYNKPCEFLAICKNGYELEKFGYQKRKFKHEEIDAL